MGPSPDLRALSAARALVEIPGLTSNGALGPRQLGAPRRKVQLAASGAFPSLGWNQSCRDAAHCCPWKRGLACRLGSLFGFQTPDLSTEAPR